MDALGNWRGTSLGNRDTRWRTVHAKLLQFIRDNGRMPRRGADDATAEEATLDVRVQNQRAKARTGKLAITRREILDDTVPGRDRTRNSKHSG